MDGRRGGDPDIVKGGETIIRIYYVRETSYSIKRKADEMCTYVSMCMCPYVVLVTFLLLWGKKP